MVAARVQRTRETEDALTSVLLTLTNRIKKDPSYPSNRIDLRQKYNTLVYTATRKAVQTSYQEGVNYVGRKTSIDTYVTDTDMANVKSQTDKAVARFWNVIENDANRDLGNEVQTKFIGGPEKPQFNTDYWMSSIALLAMTKALSSGTVSKAKQVTDQIRFQGGDPEDPTDLGLGDDDRPKFVFTWHTKQDELVCPICSELDGMEWYNDDPDIKEPGDDTHDGCRCWLDMELLEFDILDKSSVKQK